MKATVENKDTCDYVTIDVTDADAANASAVGRTAQQTFAFRVAYLMTGGTAATLFYLRGKRGVSNRGFKAMLRVERS